MAVTASIDSGSPLVLVDKELGKAGVTKIIVSSIGTVGDG